VIDLSLVFVTWNTRELMLEHLPTACVVHVSGPSSKSKEPALTRIEYHRAPYRFFRKNGGCGRMAIVLVLRIAKSLFYVMSQVPLARAEARR
jgi:hypothetical protein